MFEKGIATIPDHKNIAEQSEMRIKDLFALNEEEQQKLIQDIAKSNGVIRVFIHPYYDINHRIDHNDETAHIRKWLEYMAASNSDKQPPVFIFEEFNRVNELNSKLNETVGQNSVILVKTYRNDPMPVCASGEEGSMWKQLMAWKKLRKKFKELGVRRIIIGGMRLEVDPENIYGCVGNAARNLESDFEIIISYLSAPHSRRELNK
jgi:hypothetical protein